MQSKVDMMPPELQDLALLRQIPFAAVYLPRDFPNYWSEVTQFASQGSQSLQPQSVKIAVDNLESVDEKAFLQTSS